jgi:hypothetical protein
MTLAQAVPISCLLSLCCFVSSQAVAVDPLPKVELNTRAAGPRTVEDLTAHTIARDYRSGWQSLADAFQYSSPRLLDAYFTGTARETLGNAIQGEIRSNIHSRYRNQEHNVVAVFYSPEGDVLELHDTAQFQWQVADGNKILHNERSLHYYVVLMTPGADRWVIRQIQEVPQF